MIPENQTWELKADLSRQLRKDQMQRVQVLAVSATGETITVFGLSATRALVRAIERARFLLLYRLLVHIGEPPQSAAPTSKDIRARRAPGYRIYKRREPPARTSTTS